MRALKKENIGKFAAWLRKRFQVLAPAKMRNKKDCSFQIISAESVLDLDSKPMFSPKNLFFPSFEEMFAFNGKGAVEAEKKVPKRVLFWVRACDLNALNRMSDLFLRAPCDAYFRKARENLIIFGVKCSSAWENCFCESVGASELSGHDVEVWEEKGKYFFEGKTVEGKKLIEEFTGFEEAKGGKTAPVRSLLCSRSIDVGKIDFNKIDWSAWGKKCFACSNCVLVCPSCTCFDVFDDFNLDLKSGKRKRTWASCMTVEFSSVSNFCFRPLKPERFKQFVSHKFKYFKKEFGKHMCVGCGRCIDYCPKRIDVLEVLKEGTK